MKYRSYIEDHFLIDEPRTGKLVPFRFRPVQERYYEELKRVYNIEHKGLSGPIRELILKARREGFTSLILALFAVDDIRSDNPTETLVISYKDDATNVFRKRYRNFILSCALRRQGYSFEQIGENPGMMDEIAKSVLSIDATDIELKHNKAHFYCGTASARVGGRGGTVQKLLFSEAAYYPDKKELRAREIIEGTMRQVDVSSGWVFVESTANGDANINYYAKMWDESEAGSSRFKNRFYGWRDFYDEAQFALICSEFTDKRLIPQEYPETAQEAFLSSGDRFFDPSISQNLKMTPETQKQGNWVYYGEYVPGHRYALGADVSEGIGRHNSTCVILDFDYKTKIKTESGDVEVAKPKVIAVYTSNKIAPDLFAHEIKSGGTRYGNCVVCPERNNHGFTTLTTLKDIYFNIWHDEHDRPGWQTNMATKPKMLHELRTAIHEGLIEVSDMNLKQEIVSYPSQDLNEANTDEEDETSGHYDRLIGLALAWQMRGIATPSIPVVVKDNDAQAVDYDHHALFNEV